MNFRRCSIPFLAKVFPEKELYGVKKVFSYILIYTNRQLSNNLFLGYQMPIFSFFLSHMKERVHPYTILHQDSPRIFFFVHAPGGII